MIVEDVATSVRSTLPSPSRHAGRLCPPAFNPFAVHPSGPLRVCKVEYDLTIAPVSGEMEFRNDNLPVIQARQLERGSEIFVQASLKIFVPLTPDVVGDKNAGNPGVY